MKLTMDRDSTLLARVRELEEALGVCLNVYEETCNDLEKSRERRDALRKLLASREPTTIIKQTVTRASWNDKYGYHEVIRRDGEADDLFNQRMRAEIARKERGE